MGEIVQLSEWRARKRGPQTTPVDRLDAAVSHLDELLGARVAAGNGISRTLERELLAIADDVSSGRLEEAAERARRLASRLQHPAARHA